MFTSANVKPELSMIILSHWQMDLHTAAYLPLESRLGGFTIYECKLSSLMF
jgi:hypothetical protein